MLENNGGNYDSLGLVRQRPSKNTELNKMDTIDKLWLEQNKDTFICFSCSEGLFFMEI
jgi:hypothetical protein